MNLVRFNSRKLIVILRYNFLGKYKYSRTFYLTHVTYSVYNEILKCETLSHKKLISHRRI